MLCVCKHTHTRTHKYIHACMHTYIHTYTHKCTYIHTYIMACQNDIHSTFKISCNFQNIFQLGQTYYATFKICWNLLKYIMQFGSMYIFWERIMQSWMLYTFSGGRSLVKGKLCMTLRKVCLSSTSSILEAPYITICINYQKYQPRLPLPVLTH